jgi:sodium transport system ATP-binding protein
MISVLGLSKVFHDRKRGDVAAVDALSFECPAGGVFGLLGPNGAGKTTTLRILSTVLRPTAGTVTVCGHDVVRAPHEVRRSIGFLSGDTGVYERLTPREVIAYFGRLYGLSEARVRSRAEELIAEFEMTGYADTQCGKLSTGMKKKVSIARALVHDPPVVILDEPTSGLDILIARVLVAYVRRAKAAGKCVVYSTHVMAEAEKLCDRVAIIADGRKLAEGSVEELKSGTGAADLEEAFFRLFDARPSAGGPA